MRKQVRPWFIISLVQSHFLFPSSFTSPYAGTQLKSVFSLSRMHDLCSLNSDRFLAKMWVQVVACLVLCGTALSLQCPDGRKCEGPSICCRLPGENGYSCCDQPQFTEASLRMLTPHSVNGVPGIGCPDGSMCPVEYSCLRTPDASFACCPWEEGISCADGLHCCPKGFHCSADGHSCFQEQVLTAAATVGAVQCPDHESECPNESTCCMMPDGSWGCCPMPEASCCDDKIHCCPHATTCDLEHTRCLTASGEHQPLQKKFPAWKRALLLDPATLVERITCSDDPCPDTATCCQLSAGQYGCCPLQNAVCCKDHLHCCPQGTTCDTEHARCALTRHWLLPMTSLTVNLPKVNNVQCDAAFKCPEGNTCCKEPSGVWACCPLVDAVCCSDGVHCCPEGYRCNVEAGLCIQGSQSFPWLAKTKSLVASAGMPSSHLAPIQATLTSNIQCDEVTFCDFGQTCCKMPTGVWGCCSYDQAVCCADGLHCCPNGYTCDLAHSTCIMNTQLSPLISVSPVLTTLVRDIQCDKETSCLNGETCCRMASGKWGCCPLPNAVCCEDLAHCCPSGYQCATGSCVKSGESIPWLEKKLAIRNRISSSGDVKCDETSACPDRNTCCRKESGEWGCCPIPEAVCCADHVHCCPSGFTCDVAHGICTMSNHFSPLISVAPVLTTLAKDVKCDDQTSCPDGQTCCRLASGEWGCCPYPQAVCCEDGVHCCPQGYTCVSGACQKSQHSLPWAPKRPANTLSSHGIRCNDTASCEEGQTCCKSASGDWACCQLPNAVCCDDHEHCCPSGYTCNTAAQTCEKRQQPPPLVMGSVNVAPIVSSHTATLSRDVQCDQRHYCKGGQTCCHAEGGEWACCPYDKGTCCADKKHCCPTGFRCSRSGISCLQNGPLRWDVKPAFLRSAKAQPRL